MIVCYLLRVFVFLLFSFLLVGCTATPLLSGERVDVTNSISSQKVRFNKSHAVVHIPHMITVYTNGNSGNLLFHWPIVHLWTTSFGAGGRPFFPLLSFPIIVRNRIYTLDSNYQLSSFNILTGQKFWSFSIKVPHDMRDLFGGGIAYNQHIIYVSTGFGHVIAFNEDGKKIWTYDTHAIIRRAPIAQKGYVVINTINNSTYVLNGISGKLVWKNDSYPKSTIFLGGEGGSCIYKDYVITAYSSSDIIVNDLRNGAVIWKDNLLSDFNVHDSSILSGIYVVPVVSDNILYVVTTSSIQAISLKTFQVLWRQPFGGINKPWIAGDTIYIILNMGQLAAINKKSGVVEWTKTLPGSKYWFGPIMLANRLMIMDQDEILSIAPDTSHTLSKESIPGSWIYNNFASANGLLLVQTESGFLMAYV